MARFTVTTSTLQTAASQFSNGSVVSLGMLAGDAAADTPAASQWSDFAQAANRIHQDVYTAMQGLSGATGVAAQAYAVADDSARCSLEPN